jgi:hypothetical protein
VRGGAQDGAKPAGTTTLPGSLAWGDGGGKLLIRQRKRAAMELRDCLHQAEPKADAGNPPARITAVKALHRLALFQIGYARSVVRDRHLLRTLRSSGCSNSESIFCRNLLICTSTTLVSGSK